MIHLSGQEVRSTDTPNGIEIRYIGLRPGEKLYEELLIGDNVTGTDHPLIMRAQEAEIAWPFLEIMLKQLEACCASGDHVGIRVQLRKMVAEYAPVSEIDDHLWKRLGATSSESLVAKPTLTEASA
jgi:FlaA1/EpsC-like NDP-sugar epimerase